MTEEQAKALKVGDKVRYIGDEYYLTNDAVYEVKGIDDEGDPFIFDDNGDKEFIFGGDCKYFELAESKPPAYRIEFVDTGADFDESGMVHISAYVNDDLLAHLRDIEAEQGRDAKRAMIREQIAKLEAELDAL